MENSLNSKKYSDRYLINPTKLERLNHLSDTQSCNRTILGSSKTYEEFKKSKQLASQN
jgi:hypothetical protein